MTVSTSKLQAAMKAKQLLYLSAICLLGSGCALSDNFMRTTIIQPVQFSNYCDEKRQHLRFRELAHLEFDRARALARAELDNYDCEPFSVHEQHGFVDGFADFLLYGQTGQPPPLPPRRYWRIKHQNPNGYQAIQDWYKGYQHGACVAEASEYRKFVVVPTGDAPIVDTRPIYPGQQLVIEQSDSDDSSPAESDDDSSPELLARRYDHYRSSPVVTMDLPPQDTHSPGSAIETSRKFERFKLESLPPTERSNGSHPKTNGAERSATKGQVPPFSVERQFQIEVEPASPVEHSTHAPLESSTGVNPTPDSQTVVPETEHPSGVRPGSSLNVQQLPDVVQTSALAAKPSSSPVRLASSTGNVLSDAQQVISPAAEHASLARPELSSGSVAIPDAVLASSPPRVYRPRAQTTTEFRSKLDSHSKPHTAIFVGVVLLLGNIIWWVREHLWSGNVADKKRSQRQHPDGHGSSMQRSGSRTQTMWNTEKTNHHDGSSRRVAQTKFVALTLLFICLTTGCASLTNPVLNGIPVRRLPTELLAAPRRDGLQTIPLSLLRHEQPEDYILAPDDVMGVFIAGVFPLTLEDQALPIPPVRFPSQIDPLGAGLPPSLGFPVSIRNDGTLALPLVDPILLDGLTVEEANERVRKAYVDNGILQPGREAVLVTLMQPRQVRVLVFRQEVGGFAAGGRGDISGNNVKQGTGHIVDLRAYENDVLTALANTGGLPGLDAFDGIFIFRGGQSNAALTQMLNRSQDPSLLVDLDVKTDYIPTRWHPGEPMPFQPEDVLLNDGDVVFLEARVDDFFYTGGLLPAGERQLPRDYDLDVVEAVSRVTGTLVNGAFGGNNFTGRLIQQGIGNPNPSALTVIRRTPNGGQIPISVDLNRALIDPRERILVQPGDVLILQETRHEAIARYFNDIFNFSFVVQAVQRGSATGTAALTQLPSGR